MDLLLINPGTRQKGSLSEHLGILSLSAFARSNNYLVEVLDMALENMDVSEAKSYILEMDPKVLGISLLDNTKNKGFALIKEIRAAGYEGPIIVGGYFATFSAREILRDFLEVDYVVRGEGELTLVELLDYLVGKGIKEPQEIQGLSYRNLNQIVENETRPLIKDLDILPPVDRKYAPLILEGNHPLRVYGTRGCWGGCTFCDIIGLYGISPGKPWRRRSVQSLVNELEYLSEAYKTSEFIFNDDQFLVKGKKSLEYIDAFARELENRNVKINFDLMCRADTVSRPVMRRLKEVGLKRVFLGLESFDEKQLKRFNKGISVRQNLRALRILYQLEIDVIASVILADAYTTFFDLLKQFAVLFQLTRRYFHSKKCQISINKKLEVYKGGNVYKHYKSEGILTKDNYLDGYDYNLKVLTNLRLKMLVVEEGLSRILRRGISWMQKNLQTQALQPE